MSKTITICFLIILTSVFILYSCGDPRTDAPPAKPENPLVVIPPQKPAYPDTLPVDTGMFKVINMMIEKMQNIRMTTDFDLDFTKAMIIHHQAVIDLSQMEIAKGKDKEMRDMALEIMSKNSEEL